MKKLLTTILMLSICVASTFAQVSVEASIDSIEMFIGEQVHVTVKVVMPEKAKIVWPILKQRQQITPGVEIVNVADLGTEAQDNGLVVCQRKYTLTSFDGKLYYLPPFVLKVDNKSYQSKSLALKVVDMEVDTAHVEKFFGPKDVQENPFAWSDWAPLFWISVMMLLLATGGVYLYIRLRQGKPVVTPRLKMVRRLLPHQKAMKEIEQIKAEGINNAEHPKEYYTKLTDTLRQYIQERYGFNAMEMTSTEIINRLTKDGDIKSLDELTSLFRTADLVKFAKYSTLINENDMNLVSAIEFINSTKIENQPVEQVIKPQLTEVEQRTVKTRRALRITIGMIAIICIALLVYIVYGVYLLEQ